MKKFVTVKLIALMVTLLCLGGCMSIVVFPTDYAFSTQKQAGILAYTSSCAVDDLGVTYFINHQNRLQGTYIFNSLAMYDEYSQYIECDLPTINKPTLNFLEMRPGDYAITRWGGMLPGGGALSSQAFKPILFSINNHKVTYIGHLSLLPLGNNEYQIAIDYRNQQKDINSIKTYLKNVSANDIDTQVVRFWQGEVG